MPHKTIINHLENTDNKVIEIAFKKTAGKSISINVIIDEMRVEMKLDWSDPEKVSEEEIDATIMKCFEYTKRYIQEYKDRGIKQNHTIVTHTITQ